MGTARPMTGVAPGLPGAARTPRTARAVRQAATAPPVRAPYPRPREVVGRFGLPSELAELARPMVEPMTEQMSQVIQERVLLFGGARSAECRDYIQQAVRAAITSFVDMLAGGPRHVEAVDEMYQELGYEEAAAGRTLEHLRATMMVATHAAWRTIHRKSREYHLPDGLLGRLGDALFAHVDHLEQQMHLGHLRGRMELQQVADQWRGGLVSALLSGQQKKHELERLAASSGWVMPDEVKVAAIRIPVGMPFPDPSLIPDTLLVRLGRPVAAVVGAPAEVDRHLNRISAAFGRGAIAVSWAVPAMEASSGLRWASRALEMEEQGLITGKEVIRCAEHVAMLWVHSEPLMRDWVMHSELAPLMSEPERNRLVLAATLLALLETHGSAPALAERLGVHAQTVRYRLRRLRQLFGERLDCPEQCLSLLLALRASLPLWDQSRRVALTSPAPETASDDEVVRKLA